MTKIFTNNKMTYDIFVNIMSKKEDNQKKNENFENKININNNKKNQKKKMINNFK